MTPEQLGIYAEIERAKAEIEAMKARNQLDTLQGNHPSWGEDDFGQLAQKLGDLAARAYNT